MTNPPYLPPITWPALLQTAPCFQSAVSGAPTAEALPDARPAALAETARVLPLGHLTVAFTALNLWATAGWSEHG